MIYSAYGSGCGGPQGGAISNIRVHSEKEIVDYKTTAWAPGVVQVKYNDKFISLINPNGERISRGSYNSSRKLTVEDLSFDEYDGCDRSDVRKTKRYKLVVKDRTSTAVFYWPLINEYEAYFPIYSYSDQSLIRD